MPGLPPLPLQDLRQLPYSIQEWLRQLQILVGSTSGTVPWANINTTGSNLTDISTRLHNSLQTIQGGTSGSYYHLKTAAKGSKTHDFGSIAAGATDTTTQTVTGAGTDDVVVITPQTKTDGIVYWGYVSSADTVTIVAQNVTTGAIDPASTTFNILIMDN